MTCGDASCGHDVCNEDEVKAAAQAMAANGMQALGYNYVNLVGLSYTFALHRIVCCACHSMVTHHSATMTMPCCYSLEPLCVVRPHSQCTHIYTLLT